jgi:iron(III) transport system permease protein
MLTTRGWAKALSSPQLVTSIQNTVVVGLLTATLGVMVAALAAYTVARLRWKGRTLMDTMPWLPIAIPGMVLALGFLWAFVGLPIYKTLWVLVLAFLIWRPILQPALFAAWIYIFVIAVRTLDSALLLSGPGSEVLSVSIFQQASRGDNVVASALAIVQVGVVVVAYLLARLVGRQIVSEV